MAALAGVDRKKEHPVNDQTQNEHVCRPFTKNHHSDTNNDVGRVAKDQSGEANEFFLHLGKSEQQTQIDHTQENVQTANEPHDDLSSVHSIHSCGVRLQTALFQPIPQALPA